MTTEVLFLAIACGMTMLGYMIAINAHGPTRLSLSYLMATIMLAGTVWGIVQYVNSDLDAKKAEQFKRIETEKQIAENRAQTQEDALKQNRERMAVATKLTAVISSGSAMASTMINIDLQDRDAELEVLMARAGEMKKKTDELKTTFEKIGILDTSFNEVTPLIKEAVQAVVEAGYYYRSFYYSEDSEQEELRARVLRQKARTAYDKFQKATAALSSPKL